MEVTALSALPIINIASLSKHWITVLGVVAMSVSTLHSLAVEHWSTEAGAHGPLVLATGFWLIWRRLKSEGVLLAERRPWLVFLLLFSSLAVFVVGRAFDYLILQSAGLYVTILTLVYERSGSRLLRQIAFPLVYIGMILPIPGWILDQMTGPLKQLASLVTTDLLQLFGVPIIREGVILYVDQYQLLVEDACAGLNALMGLTALGLFYAYLAHGPSWKYSALLLLFIVPIAVVANVVRIIILVILTIWGGNEAAQGYLHGAAGLVMFTAALVLVFALDNILSRGLPPPSASLAT